MRAMGVFLLLGVTGYLAFFVSLRRQRHLALREGLLLLLYHLSANLESFSIPLSQIYASFQNDALEKSGFLPTLRQAGLYGALCAHKHNLALSQEEEGLLYPFAKQIGKGFLKEEQALCRYTKESFEGLYGTAKRELPKKRKMEAALVVSGGLMVILLFI
ncbi:MAG: hypothetical protein J6K61_05490 [Clostridia bacterium]|nr:hypothetical protein [Clostridia bacterium]